MTAAMIEAHGHIRKWCGRYGQVVTDDECFEFHVRRGVIEGLPRQNANVSMYLVPREGREPKVKKVRVK